MVNKMTAKKIIFKDGWKELKDMEAHGMYLKLYNKIKALENQVNTLLKENYDLEKRIKALENFAGESLIKEK